MQAEDRKIYLRRKVDEYLDKWKNNPDHMPLIIKGARQIGKTESILHFAEKNYENVIYINFALQKQYRNILSDGYSVSSLIKNITLVNSSVVFKESNTDCF